MVSQKFQSKIGKYQERNYAPKVRKIEKSDLGKYSYGSASRETPEASSSDSILESWKEQEEIKETTNGQSETGNREEIQSISQEVSSERATSRRRRRNKKAGQIQDGEAGNSSTES